jgi:hypothetical protein
MAVKYLQTLIADTVVAVAQDFMVVALVVLVVTIMIVAAAVVAVDQVTLPLPIQV